MENPNPPSNEDPMSEVSPGAGEPEAYFHAKQELVEALMNLEVGLQQLQKASPPRQALQVQAIPDSQNLKMNEDPVPDLPPESKIIEGEGDKPMTELDAMLNKCKEIALNKAFHGTLINDQVMCSFLVYCLGETSEERVFKALDIFHLLAIHPENRPGLSKVLMFFEALKTAANNKFLSKEIREFAVLVYGNVREVSKPLKARGNRMQTPAATNIHGKCARDKEDKPKGEHRANPSRNQSLSKTGRLSQFYTPQCIFKDKRLRMTEALLTQQGIISITYDLKKSYCIVRGKPHVSSETFGKAIANLGFECHLVSKNENDEDILTRMDSDLNLENSNNSGEKENYPLPDYLSDSDTDQAASPERGQAVALTGQPEQKKTGWISSATNFFQKSFYW